MGEVKRALTMLRDLMEKFPSSWFICNTYAKVLCLNKQYEAAMKAHDKAISIAPEQAMLYLNKAQIVDQWARRLEGCRTPVPCLIRSTQDVWALHIRFDPQERRLKEL